jgi:hypothetical protein
MKKNKPTHVRMLRHTNKRYKVYVAEAPEHYESIMNKYGMPRIAHPPLEDDVIERVIADSYSGWKKGGSWSLKNG